MVSRTALRSFLVALTLFVNGSAFATDYYVNAGAGSDSNNGLTPVAAFKTIKKAVSILVSGDYVHVAAGIYDLANGETFPINVPGGAHLYGENPMTTIIDATGSNQRVLYFNFVGPGNEVQDFTITGGLAQAASGEIGAGGGIYVNEGCCISLRRLRVIGNEARGFDGGGQALGGGVYLNAGTIYCSIIANNIARAGHGANQVSSPGGSGGSGQGGGVYCTNQNFVSGSTLYGNQVIGGDGGTSVSASGGVGGNATAGGAINCHAESDIFAANTAIAGAGGAGSSGTAAAGTALAGGYSGALASYSLFFNNLPTTGEATGSLAVIADPLFADAANGDYHVSPSSPAKSAGSATPKTRLDFDRVTRAILATIGAFEAVNAATATTLMSSQNPSTLDQAVTFTASVTSNFAGMINGDVTFRDGGSSLGMVTLSGGSASITTSSLQQGSHSITATYSGDATYAGSSSAPLTQTVNLPPFGAPPNFRATATTATSVAMSWTPVSGASSYDILRSTGSGFSLVASGLTTPVYTDSPVSSGTAYLYAVRAVGSGFSANSVDLATTVLFNDDPLAAAAIVKAVHITDLRVAVNAVRSLAGLPGAVFTDAALNGIPIKAVHLTQLREALDQARSVLTLPAVSYTDSTIVAGSTVIKRLHILDLRNGVR